MEAFQSKLKVQIVFKNDQNLLSCVHLVNFIKDLDQPCTSFILESLASGGRPMRPLPARRQGKHLCVLAFRTLEDNFRIILVCLRWIGLEALTGWTLEVDTKPQRPGACMCPSESCHLARLKLDNISMCAESLVLTKEVFDVWSVENEMHKRPIHNVFVCARRLKIPLGKTENFFEDLTDNKINYNCLYIYKSWYISIRHSFNNIPRFGICRKCTTRKKAEDIVLQFL